MNAALRPGTKSARHQLIVDLVTHREVRSQSELAELLAESGGGQASGAPPFTLSHNVDSDEDVLRVYERAIAAGATSLREPAPVEWGGFTAYVADPDGFRWEIAHNPGWGVKPDGSIRLQSLTD